MNTNNKISVNDYQVFYIATSFKGCLYSIYSEPNFSEHRYQENRKHVEKKHRIKPKVSLSVALIFFGPTNL